MSSNDRRDFTDLPLFLAAIKAAFEEGASWMNCDFEWQGDVGLVVTPQGNNRTPRGKYPRDHGFNPDLRGEVVRIGAMGAVEKDGKTIKSFSFAWSGNPLPLRETVLAVEATGARFNDTPPPKDEEMKTVVPAVPTVVTSIPSLPDPALAEAPATNPDPLMPLKPSEKVIALAIKNPELHTIGVWTGEVDDGKEGEVRLLTLPEGEDESWGDDPASPGEAYWCVFTDDSWWILPAEAKPLPPLNPLPYQIYHRGEGLKSVAHLEATEPGPWDTVPPSLPGSHEVERECEEIRRRVRKWKQARPRERKNGPDAFLTKETTEELLQLTDNASTALANWCIPREVLTLLNKGAKKEEFEALRRPSGRERESFFALAGDFSSEKWEFQVQRYDLWARSSAS
jgi:hypothetical protein